MIRRHYTATDAFEKQKDFLPVEFDLSEIINFIESIPIRNNENTSATEIGQSFLYGDTGRRGYRKSFPYFLEAAKTGDSYCLEGERKYSRNLYRFGRFSLC